jgi:alpha-tubulin suppressor-like RCC1 family protein
MDKSLPFDNYEYSNNLKNYFKNNIKLTLKTNFTVIVITKNDIFYEINNLDNKIHSFILNNQNSIIESTIVEELSHKGITHLAYGLLHYFARTFDNKIYCWGHNGWGQFGTEKDINKTLKILINQN